MGWWSSVVALQGEAANHRKVRRSRVGVLSVAGDGAPARYGSQRNEHAAHWLRARAVQAVETVRARVALRGAGADRLVVAGKPGNAGGATGAGHPDSVGGQPRCRGMSR